MKLELIGISYRKYSVQLNVFPFVTDLQSFVWGRVSCSAAVNQLCDIEHLLPCAEVVGEYHHAPCCAFFLQWKTCSTFKNTDLIDPLCPHHVAGMTRDSQPRLPPGHLPTSAFLRVVLKSSLETLLLLGNAHPQVRAGLKVACSSITARSLRKMPKSVKATGFTGYGL